MTQLNCSVRSCNYQKDDCCCRGSIMIEGAHADRHNETCCGSFEERRGCGCNNSTAEAPKMSDVSCEATNCRFNADKKCSATDIGVAGSNACSCAETECASFQCR